MTDHQFKVGDVFVWFDKNGVIEGSNGIPHICRVVEVNGNDLISLFVVEDRREYSRRVYPADECTLLDDGSETLADIKRRYDALKAEYESISNQYDAVCKEESDYYQQLYETNWG